MAHLSIALPDTLATASHKAARSLGISRTEFIRQAIIHELDTFNDRLEEDGIIKSFAALKTSSEYYVESQDIDATLGSSLPEEEEEWWIKSKS